MSTYKTVLVTNNALYYRQFLETACRIDTKKKIILRYTKLSFWFEEILAKRITDVSKTGTRCKNG
jgi:hypothetical protein